MDIRSPRRGGSIALCAVLICGAAPSAHADPPAVSLTLEEAIELALTKSYAMRKARLNVDQAEAQVDQGYGAVYPRVDLSASYTRTLAQLNPFAGSDAGGLFAGFAAIDWLAFNEGARTDGDDTTIPITLTEFLDRQAAGRAAAGIQEAAASDNPFFVPNSARGGITITQVLYEGKAFAAIKGAKELRGQSAAAMSRQTQRVVGQTARAFYQALLANQQTVVLHKSVERTRETLSEVEKRVAQGVSPTFQKLSAEVELANLETELIQVENRAEAAKDMLKLVVGLPIEQPLQLSGVLALPAEHRHAPPSLAEAIVIALQSRPDLDGAQRGIALLEVQEDFTRAEYYPSVSAFFDASYAGNIPDDRTVTVQDPNDPFAYSSRTNGPFSGSYWGPNVTVGVQLNWNIFNGFVSSSVLEQNRLDTAKARVDYEELVATVKTEVEGSLRDLRAAWMRLESQAQNVDRAEQNYEHAALRVREGVSTQLELRDASQQLDQSRFLQLQAIHDYLVATASYGVAVGTPPFVQGGEGKSE